MIREISDVFSWFRIFIWILVFIAACLNISIYFTVAYCWTGTSTFIDFISRVRILPFKSNKLLIFLVDHLTAMSNLWWTKDYYLSKNLSTLFSFLMQNGSLTKINFLDSVNKKSGISFSFLLTDCSTVSLTILMLEELTSTVKFTFEW